MRHPTRTLATIAGSAVLTTGIARAHVDPLAIPLLVVGLFALAAAFTALSGRHQGSVACGVWLLVALCLLAAQGGARAR